MTMHIGKNLNIWHKSKKSVSLIMYVHMHNSVPGHKELLSELTRSIYRAHKFCILYFNVNNLDSRSYTT